MATHRPIAGRKLSRRMRSIFKTMAAGIQPSTYTAYHKDTVDVPQFVGGAPVLNADGTPFVKTFPTVRPEQHAVNHFRRLKRTWATRGIDGLTDYLRSVGASALSPQV